MTFYRRKTDFYEKKIRRFAVCRVFMTVQMKILSANFLKHPLISDGIGLTGFDFDLNSLFGPFSFTT
jgi:hypothetical protein